MSRMDLEKSSPQTPNQTNLAVLPETVAPEAYHFATILDRGTKAGRSLE